MAKERDDKMVFNGIVVDVSRDVFRVELENTKQIITCTISGKIRRNNIHILKLDKVTIEMGLYDSTKGRIILRLKN